VRISKKDRSKVPDIKAFEKAKVFQRLELDLGLVQLPSSSRPHFITPAIRRFTGSN